jgi:hypothetical protein
MPVHAYGNVDPIDLNEDGTIDCFKPIDEMAAYDAVFTLEDYTDGDPYILTLENVPLSASGFVYVNIHLDYGLKGPVVDADGDGLFDRYDKTSNPDGTSDAVDFNDTAQISIADRTQYVFSYTANGISHSDTVENINEFKKIPGVAGFVYDDSILYIGQDITVKLVIPDSVKGVGGEILDTMADEDGWYMIEYKHKGKPTDYLIQLWKGEVKIAEYPIPLKGNAFVEWHFDESIP